MPKVVATTLEPKQFCCWCEKKTWYEYIPYKEKFNYEEDVNMIKFKRRWYVCVECM